MRKSKIEWKKFWDAIWECANNKGLALIVIIAWIVSITHQVFWSNVLAFWMLLEIAMFIDDYYILKKRF
jgi:hypothetical protein